MNSKFWRSWVGLPWRLYADPRTDRAACCFRTTQAAREEMGMYWPTEKMDRWYSMANNNEWIDLRNEWDEHTYIVDGPPRAGLITKFDCSDGSFGLGVLVPDNVLIAVKHKGRLCALPSTVISTTIEYREVKQ